jgi:hypothetical protein
VSGPDVIGYLRAHHITLIYDSLSKTLRADTAEAPATIIGHAS